MIKKIIRLTESELNKVVKNAATIVLNEMAYHRNEFVAEIKSQTTEIIRNYALIFYAHKHNLQTINHWRGELITLITNFQDMETKPKTGNRKMVKKVIQEEWVEKMELKNHPETIIHKYIAKFNDESITLTPQEHMEIAESFIGHMDELANEMAYGDYNSALKYVNSI